MPPVELELRVAPTTALLLVASPLALVGLGVLGLAVGDGGPALPLVFLIGGLGLAATAGWSLPLAVRLDADGVTWRAPLRRREIDWDDVVAVERHRRKAKGALVLRTAEGERIALTDVVERPHEWDRLREVVDRYAPGCAVPDPPRGHPFLGRDL